MRLSQARSVSALAEESGPSMTLTRISDPSRRIDSSGAPISEPLLAKLVEPTSTWSMRRSSDSSPNTSVPLPGSIETRAFGATSQRRAARSMRPRRLRVVLPV